MKNYLLTHFGSVEQEKAWETMTPEQMQAGLAQFMEYTQRLVDKGQLIAGEGLSPVGVTIQPFSLEVVEGPYVLANELVGGFYYIKAESLEQAIAIAKENPALQYGYKIEVREQMEY